MKIKQLLHTQRSLTDGDDNFFFETEITPLRKCHRYKIWIHRPVQDIMDLILRNRK
jgi:hypothetical protein